MSGALLCACTALLALAHPDSQSQTLIRIGGGEMRLEQRLQSLSLLEVLPELDGDADAFLSRSELERGREQVADYLRSHYRLRTGTALDGRGGRALELHLVELLPEPPDPTTGAISTAVLARLACGLPEELDDLLVESSLFLATSPAHRDFLTLRFGDSPPRTEVLDSFVPRQRFRPERGGLDRQALLLGASQLLRRPELPLFLLALVLACRRSHHPRCTLAFLLALLLGLLARSQAWPSLAIPERFLVSAAALSVAYVPADAWLVAGRARAPWPECALFGCLQGLALALPLRSAASLEPMAAGTGVGYLLGLCASASGIALLLGLLARAMRWRPLAEGGRLARWLALPLLALGTLCFLRATFL